jgi:integrase/recombinase XerC
MRPIPPAILPRLDLIPRGQITPAAIQAFYAYLQTTPATVATYRAGIRNFLTYLQSLTTAEALQPTRQTLIAYRAYLIQNYRPATVNLYITSVHCFFSWLSQEGLYSNIADHVKGIKTTRGHKRDSLTAPAVREILDTITPGGIIPARDHAIICLMATTGIRSIEVLRANVEDLRLFQGIPVLYIQGKGRTEKADFVKITQPVFEAIREYIRRRGNVPGAAPLFASEGHFCRGQRLSRRSLSRLIKQRFRAAGYDLKTLTAHSLRHTAATLALLNGETVEEVQQLLRHTDINTTMIYNHSINRITSNAENSITGAIFGR